MLQLLRCSDSGPISSHILSHLRGRARMEAQISRACDLSPSMCPLATEKLPPLHSVAEGGVHATHIADGKMEAEEPR